MEEHGATTARSLESLRGACAELRAAAKGMVVGAVGGEQVRQADEESLLAVGRMADAVRGLVFAIETSGWEGWRTAAAPALFRARAALGDANAALLLVGSVSRRAGSAEVAEAARGVTWEATADALTETSLERGDVHLALAVLAGGVGAGASVAAQWRLMWDEPAPAPAPALARPADIARMLERAEEELQEAGEALLWPGAEVEGDDEDEDVLAVLERRLAQAARAAAAVGSTSEDEAARWLTGQGGGQRLRRIAHAALLLDAVVVTAVKDGEARAAIPLEHSDGIAASMMLEGAADRIGLVCAYLQRQRPGADRIDCGTGRELLEALDDLNRVWADGSLARSAGALVAAPAAELRRVVEVAGQAAGSLAVVVHGLGLQAAGRLAGTGDGAHRGELELAGVLLGQAANALSRAGELLRPPGEAG